MGPFTNRLLRLVTLVGLGSLAIGCVSPQIQSDESLTATPDKVSPASSQGTVTPDEEPSPREADTLESASGGLMTTEWRQEASPSVTEVCKVKDGLPSDLLAVGRGSYLNGAKARGPVGFPWTSTYFFPTQGRIKMLAISASFNDTEKFVDQPVEFWGPQAHEIEKWAAFWSQGKIAYDMTVVDEWIELPYASSAAPADDGVLAAHIVERLPADVQVDEYDAIYIYWAHGITPGTRNTFGLRLNSIDSQAGAQTDASVRQMIWSADEYQYTDSGRLTQELKEESLWTYLIHEILHETNLNLHAPGNGWATGVGQNHYPTHGGGQSVAITAWEQFLLGWMDDEQIHCVSPEDLSEERQVILTPLEIFGGERRALIVPISDSDVLVVESRRPIGYSSTWSPENEGLLAYTVNPQEPTQLDHIDVDCGNDPTYTKWAYYLFPDEEPGDPSSWCGARGGRFSPAIINEGETLTHNGVRVELVYSSDEQDFLKVVAPR